MRGKNARENGCLGVGSEDQTSIAAIPEAVPLSEDQKMELDRRLEAYHRNPDAGSPWIEVRERLRNRSRS